MEFLPTTEEQKWLVSRLADLIASRGAGQFVDMPLVEPTREFFPDPWTFSHEGLDRLVRRLMQYAGLRELDATVGTYVEMDAAGRSASQDHVPSTSGLFMGIDGGRCLFAFNEQAPADAEFMAGVMCHEVAHAYREFHGLARSAIREEEELLTDLTAVYLGFGILAANNSFRYRTAGWNAGAWATFSSSVQATGYLPSQAFAFVLAIQMVARGLGPDERSRLLKHLETDQAAFTKASLDAVLQREPEIMGALRLDSAAGREQPIRLEDILRPLPAYDGPVPSHDTTAVKAPLRFNEGRPVFRVPRNRAHIHSFVGLCIGLGVGAAGGFFVRHPELGAVGGFLGGVLGFLSGYRSRFEVCSDPKCEAVLGTGATCPKCGGEIAGKLRHADERLEAEEEWERQRKTEPRK